MAAQPSEEAMKTRVITHMNADHQSSLCLYLQHYNRIPAASASTAKLTDIDLTHMVLESSAGRTLIPFDPPMKSLSESRQRLVTMNQESLTGLGLSSIVINEYVNPNRLWQVGLYALSFFCVTTLGFRAQLLPQSGSVLYYIWSLGGNAPFLARLAYIFGPFALPFIIIAHTIEAGWMVAGRLRKHQVPMFGEAWMKWTMATFLGGAAAITRFDELVSQREEAQKAKRH